MITCFEAFPNAVKTWTLAEVADDTVTGLATTVAEYSVPVLVDRSAATTQATDSTAAVVSISTLIYADPAKLPSQNPQTYLVGYRWIDEAGQVYKITTAELGFNQETNELEHIEFVLEAVEDLA